MTEPDSDDVMALAGLRRLVLHARDNLARQTYTPKWNYNHDAWKPWQVQQYAAMTLARHTLTLVADCLPGAAGISADEAAELAANHAKALEREQNRAEKAEAQLAASAAEAEAAGQETIDLAADLESAQEQAEAWSAQWQRLLTLAQTDVPAAMRYLLAGGVEEDPAEEGAACVT